MRGFACSSTGIRRVQETHIRTRAHIPSYVCEIYQSITRDNLNCDIFIWRNNKRQQNTSALFFTCYDTILQPLLKKSEIIYCTYIILIYYTLFTFQYVFRSMTEGYIANKNYASNVSSLGTEERDFSLIDIMIFSFFSASYLHLFHVTVQHVVLQVSIQCLFDTPNLSFFPQSLLSVKDIFYKYNPNIFDLWPILMHSHLVRYAGPIPFLGIA